MENAGTISQKDLFEMERKAQEIMGPKERVATQARKEIMGHLEDFLKVNITEEDVQRAAVEAENRALAEYDRKEANPLGAITEAIKAVATEQDRVFVDAMTTRIEELKSKIASTITPEKLAEAARQGITAEALIRQMWNGRQIESSFVTPPEDPNEQLPFPVEIPTALQTEVGSVEIDEAFILRIVTQLTGQNQVRGESQDYHVKQDSNIPGIFFYAEITADGSKKIVFGIRPDAVVKIASGETKSS